MSWFNVGGAAVGVVGGMLTQDKNGGAGASSASKDPWSNAVPLLVRNLNSAYGLQTKYEDAPFNAGQLAAFRNQGAISDYGREVVPQLLSQISAQPLGYDKNNPNARPQAFNLNSGALASRLAEAAKTPAPAPMAAPAPAAAPAAPQFVNQGGSALDFASAYLQDPRGQGLPQGMARGQYGSYNYGDPITAQNETDARMYALLGGQDPYGHLALFGSNWKPGGAAGGPGSGGIGAAGGAGAGSAAGGPGW